jgi:lysophospholipase L1-like esterase
VSTSGTYQALNRTRVTFGSRGAHTVTIAATSAPVYISGVFVYDQDENAGIHGYDGGWSGATINLPYLQDLGAGGWSTTLAAVAPDLVTIDLIGNDGINGTTTTAFEANARQLIELLQALPKVPSIVWCTSYQVASSVTSTSFAPYDAIIKELATEYGIGVVSWYDEIDTVGTGNTVGNWTGDGIHPANSGHQMLADLVVDYLTT